MTERPLVVGPATGPEPPYPFRMEGKVISGFGRGSKELGIPTANLPVDADGGSSSSTSTPWIASVPSGVYFGWASLRLPASHPDATKTSLERRWTLYPMVMSIGYNPFYKNTVRSAEVHVLHVFAADFYGVPMRLLITGFIRDEKDYAGLDALIADINFDCDVARRSLARAAWRPAGATTGSDDQTEEEGTLDCSWLLRSADDDDDDDDNDGKGS